LFLVLIVNSYALSQTVSLLVEHSKMMFYNKTLHSNNPVCLASICHIFPGKSSSIDIKRDVWL